MDNLLTVAKRFVGHVKEVPGEKDHPFIVWALYLCGLKDEHDETAWCSAFVNAICFICGIKGSMSASARSWLKVGAPVYKVSAAIAGQDIVVFKRGDGPQPGPEVLNAPGHVAFYVSHDSTHVNTLDGNVGNQVTFTSHPIEQILGIRRLV